MSVLLSLGFPLLTFRLFRVNLRHNGEQPKQFLQYREPTVEDASDEDLGSYGMHPASNPTAKYKATPQQLLYDRVFGSLTKEEIHQVLEEHARRQGSPRKPTRRKKATSESGGSFVLKAPHEHNAADKSNSKISINTSQHINGVPQTLKGRNYRSIHHQKHVGNVESKMIEEARNMTGVEKMLQRRAERRRYDRTQMSLPELTAEQSSEARITREHLPKQEAEYSHSEKKEMSILTSVVMEPARAKNTVQEERGVVMETIQGASRSTMSALIEAWISKWVVGICSCEREIRARVLTRRLPRLQRIS